MNSQTTPAPSASRWNRRALQARSRVTQDLILDAAEELFAERGIDSTSVQDVAARAGRSIGSFYHHFDTKEILVHAVTDRIISDTSAEMDAFFDPDRWIDAGIETILTAYVKGTLGLDRVRPGYKRIGLEASLTDTETSDRYRRLRIRVNEGLRQLLIERKNEISHANPDLAIGLVIDQLTAMVRARINPESDSTLLSSLPDKDYVELVISSAVGFLGLDRAG